MRSPVLPACALLLVAASGCRPEYDGQVASEDLLERSDLLVIAPDETYDGFEEFVEWKRCRGIPTTLVSLDEIDDEEEGEDQAARIRSRIQRGWESEGTRWVVLGADAGLLPVRRVDTFVDVSFEGAYYEDSVVSDLYYSDLDGDWDGDGDGDYGEVGDGMDLLPDLAIARIPAHRADQVVDYTEKVYLYERWPETDYQQTAMLMGEWAGEASGLTVYSSSALESMLLPLFPDEFDVTRMYEAYEDYEGSVPNTRDNQFDYFSAGQNLILNFGHGLSSYIGKLGLSQIWDLENFDRPSIFATTECSGCDFDNEYVDYSACEAFVLAQGGGVAYLGNTHVGIGFPSLTNFYVLFYETLFEDQEQLTLGERMAATLREYSTPEQLEDEGGPDRWTNLVMVLMGDPTIVPWRSIPVEPDVQRVDWYRQEGSKVGCYTVELDGEPVQGAAVTWYKAGQLLRSATTGAQGQACLAVPKDAPKKVLLTVTGPDLLPVEKDQRL